MGLISLFIFIGFLLFITYSINHLHHLHIHSPTPIVESDQTVGGHDIRDQLRILQRNYTYMHEMELLFWIIDCIIISSAILSRRIFPLSFILAYSQPQKTTFSLAGRYCSFASRMNRRVYSKKMLAKQLKKYQRSTLTPLWLLLQYYLLNRILKNHTQYLKFFKFHNKGYTRRKKIKN